MGSAHGRRYGPGMKRTAALAAACLMSATLLAGCSSEPDLAACEDAMREQFSESMSEPSAAEGERPEECEGVSDADLEEIAGNVIADALDG